MKTNIFITLLLAGFVLIGTVAEGARRTSRTTKKTAKASVAAKKAPASATVSDISSNSSADVSYAWKAYPDTAKTPAEAKLLAEREVPKTVRPNQEYTYVVKVTNQSFFKIDDVVITERIPEGFKLIKANPSPEMRGKEMKWNLGIMAPEQTEVITITGKAQNPGKLYHSGSAKANFALNRMVAIMEVLEPSLSLKAVAPENVIIGESFPVKLLVNNIGSAIVHSAKMSHTFPQNMMTDTGDQKINVNLSDIRPGQIKTINLKLRAIKTGKYDNKFIVTAKDNVKAQANLTTFVRKPRLKLSAKAPKMRFVGNVIRYDLKVTNVGDGNANKMATKLSLGSGTTFVSANEGAKFQGGNIVWQTTSLQPNETKELTARVKANNITTVNAQAVTSAIAAEPVKVDLTTSVKGIAALLLKVDDINDPVPVGDTETYIIKVMNQGSLPATNIRISCDLETSMEFVKSNGPSKGAVATGTEGKNGAILLKKAGKALSRNKSLSKGKVVVFDALPSLAPKKEAVWQVVVKALKEGDFRFNVNLISDQLARPVNENESTTFYQD